MSHTHCYASLRYHLGAVEVYSMGETIRIGLIGAGGNTRVRHLPEFQKIADVEIVAIANRSNESASAFAAEFNLEVETSGDPYQVIGSSDVDAVCIGTWPNKHREYTIAALEAGKHVLVEARMAMNASEAADMLKSSEAHPDLVSQIVPAPMDFKSWRTIKRLVDEGESGELGTVREVHVSVLNGQNLAPSPELHWRDQTELSGMNIMMYGITVEMIHRWLGPTKELIADGQTFVSKKLNTDTGEIVEVDIPDSLSVVARQNNGARVIYNLSTVAGTPTSPNGATLFGSKGTLVWSFAEDALSFAALGGTPSPYAHDDRSVFDWQVESDFVESIRSNAPVILTNFQDGLEYMKVVEATYHARKDGKRVVIN